MTAKQGEIPVITIDGPSGSGKGTISRLLANELGWHFLDSGALYRLVAQAAQHHAIALDNEQALETIAAHLDVEFVTNESGSDANIYLEGEDVTKAIRCESCGGNASKVGSINAVRRALLARQRAFQQAPGLVADGRDMGTVVFPGAPLKIFLTASLEERAARRYKQLNEKGLDGNLAALLDELAQRDERDKGRSASPLKPASDAVVIDSSNLGIKEVIKQVRELWQQSLERVV